MACFQPKRRRLTETPCLHELKNAGTSDKALCKLLHQLAGQPDLLHTLADTSLAQIDHMLRSGIQELWSKAALELRLPQVKKEKQLADFVWHLQSPGMLLQEVCKSCTPWSDAVKQACEKHGCCLSIILYCDEITPGNPLRPDNKRKLTAFYFSFREFNQALRNELAWLPVAILRHDKISKVPGGLSEVAKQLVWTFLKDSPNFLNGVTLQLGAEKVKVTAKITNVIGDESALKSFWSSKGAAGMRPCMMCKNIIAKGSKVLRHLDTPYWIDISQSDHARFDVASDEDIFAAVDTLRDLQVSSRKGAFKEAQKAFGFSYSSSGILCDTALRTHLLPASTNTFDSMRCYFSQGIAALELHLFLQACRKKLKLRFSDVHSIVSAGWQHPKCVGSKVNVAEVFSDSREEASEKAESFKGMASEVLAVLPFVRHVAELIATGDNMVKELASLRGMHQLVDKIQQIKKSYPVSEVLCLELDQLQSAHMKLFRQAYTNKHFKPKHHLSRHIPQQVRRDKMLLDTFVHERKHRLAKSISKDVVGSESFEKAVLSRMILQQIKDLKTFSSFLPIQLLGKIHTLPSALANSLFAATCVTCAPTLECYGVKVWIGDLVMIEADMAKIVGCLLIDGSAAMLLDMLTLTGSHGYAKVWKSSKILRYVLIQSLSRLQLVPNWNLDQNGNIITLA